MSGSASCCEQTVRYVNRFYLFRANMFYCSLKRKNTIEISEICLATEKISARQRCFFRESTVYIFTLVKTIRHESTTAKLPLGFTLCFGIFDNFTQNLQNETQTMFSISFRNAIQNSPIIMGWQMKILMLFPKIIFGIIDIKSQTHCYDVSSLRQYLNISNLDDTSNQAEELLLTNQA